MLGYCAGLPHDPDPHLATLAALIEHHLFDQQTDDLLALGCRHRGRAPQLWQVCGESQDLRAVRLAQGHGLLVPPAAIVLLDLLDPAELLLPSALQRASNEAVLRLDRIILPTCPLGLVARPLAPERPLPLEQARLLLHLAQGRDSQGDPVGGERRQHQALYLGIDLKGTHFLAARLPFDRLTAVQQYTG